MPRIILTRRAKIYKTWYHFSEGFLKISLSIIALFISGFTVCSSSFAQETRVEGQNKSSPAIKKEQQAGSESSKKKTQQFVTGGRTRQKIDFSGTVTSIDAASAALSIRNQGKTISFDISKVILTGYGTIGEIKKGDQVSVGYTQSGLQLHKGVFAITPRESIPYREVVPQKAFTKAGTTKPQRTTPIRMVDINHPTNFRDIDNNKDGKITAIELCVLVPDLTLQKFKEYDKNGDGCLNEREFSAVKRTR
jgi:hypothetical protein